jgi:ABC-type branched-subunit amino acid transport system substrate-binding protein
MRNQINRWSKRIVVVSTFVSLGLLLGFSSECPAQKPEIINLPYIGCTTGPYVAIAGPGTPAMLDAVSYINKELGGVRGVKINPVVRDMGAAVATGVQQYEEVIRMKPKPYAVSAQFSPLNEALRDKFVTDNVIGFVGPTLPSVYPAGNAYASMYSYYPSMTAVGVKWFKDNFKEQRRVRAAIITWDTSYGRAIMVPEFHDYCKQIGVDIVAEELFGMRDIDVTTQMVRIRAKKPDLLITCTTGQGYMSIMKAVKELGLNVPLLNSEGGDWGTVRLNPELFEGCIVVLHCESFDNTAHPGMKKLLSYMKENNRTEKEKTVVYLAVWHTALLFHKVMTDAVDKVGWDKLDTNALKNELNHLTNWEPLNGIVRLTYTDKSRLPLTGAIFKVQNGKFINAIGPGVLVDLPNLIPAQYR